LPEMMGTGDLNALAVNVAANILAGHTLRV
jgi:hypothetical protein